MSSHYLKITPQFWIGETGKVINQLGCETQLVALYLMTNSHANLLGMYYLPQIFIAHETGIPFTEVTKALQNLFKIKFCSYDSKLEYVWVHEMALYQVDGLNHNQVREINKSYHLLPNLSFLKDFYAKYKDRLLLEKVRENRSFFDSPLRPGTEIEHTNEAESAVTRMTSYLKINKEDVNNDKD